MLARPVKMALRAARLVNRNFSQQVVQNSQSGGSRITPKRLDDYFNRIDMEAKRTGRVVTRDLLGVYSLVKEAPVSSPTHSLMLIRCCGSLLSDESLEKRNQLLDEIWATLKSSQKLDISHYNALLQVYIENLRQFEPMDFLKMIEAAGLEPNRVTFQKLVHVYCMRGDIDGTLKVLELLKQKDMSVNEPIFNSLIMGYGVLEDYETAKGTLDLMQKSDVLPTSATYTVLLRALAKVAKKDPKQFTDIWKRAESEGVFFMDRQRLDIVRALMLNDAPDDVCDMVLATMQRKVGYVNEATKVTGVLLDAGKVDAAFKLFNSLPVPSTAAKTKSHGMAFIYQLVKSGHVPHEKVFDFCKDLRARDLNDFGIYKATEAAIENRDMQTCQVYMKEFIQEKHDPVARPHYYWPLLAKADNEQEVFEIMAQFMSGVSMTATAAQLIETLESYVWPKVQDTGLALERLKALGYSYTVSLTSLVRYLLLNNDGSTAITLLRNPRYQEIGVLPNLIDYEIGLFASKTARAGEAVSLLKAIMRSPRLRPEYDCVSAFLSGLLSNGALERDVSGTNLGTQVLRMLKQERLRLTPEASDKIMRRFPLNETQRQLLTDITMGTNEIFTGEGMEMDRTLSSTVEELENDLLELKSKGMNTRGVLRSLLLRYCRNYREALAGSFDDEIGVSGLPKPNEARTTAINRVNEILNEIKAQDMPLSDAMMAVMMEFYALTGEFDKAFEMKNQISPNFAIDDFKVMSFATSLVRAGKKDEAIRLLQDELKHPARRQDDQDEAIGDSKRLPIERALFRLLNAAAIVTKDPEYVNKMFNLATNFRPNTKITNVILGPRIKVHILNNDLEAALSEFTKCVADYKMTPWSGELMKLLIEKDDAANLQLLTDLCNSCHGEGNTMYDLVSAFIRAKKINQAKKVIASTGLRLNTNKIIVICDRMIRDHTIDDLKNFIDVAKEIPNVDQDELCFQLIRGYKSIDDPKAALNVWLQMQEEGIIPSAKTLAYLGTFLRSKGLSVPFEIPDVAAYPSEPVNGRAERSQLEADFKRAINIGDAATAFQLRKERLSKGEMPTITQENSLLDKLMERGMIDEAYQVVMQLAQEKSFPVPRLLRNLSRALGENGRVEQLEKLKPLLPTEFTNQTFFSECVAEGYTKSGQEEALLEKLPTINPFPLSTMMKLLADKPHLEERLTMMANKLALTDQYYLPLNMLWLHRLKNQRFEEADAIIRANPRLRSNLLFASVLKNIREEQNIAVADKLIETLNMTYLSPRSLGIAMSAKIDVLVDTGREEAAETMLLDMISNPKERVNEETGMKIPPVQLSDINRMALIRLYSRLTEKTGRTPSFEIPEKDDRRNGQQNKQEEQQQQQHEQQQQPAAAL